MSFSIEYTLPCQPFYTIAIFGAMLSYYAAELLLSEFCIGAAICY